MKKDVHPTYYPNAKIACACGASYTIGSTVKEIRVELCSNCHPFFTGKQKLVDTSRRVEKFQERLAKRATAAASRGGRASKTTKRQVKKEKRSK